MTAARWCPYCEREHLPPVPDRADCRQAFIDSITVDAALIKARRYRTGAMFIPWSIQPHPGITHGLWHRPRGPIKLQAKHIPDETFLNIVARATITRPWITAWDNDWAPLLMPEKVIRAKARALIARKLLDGCDRYHRCRGDWYLTPAGVAMLFEAGMYPGQDGRSLPRGAR